MSGPTSKSAWTSFERWIAAAWSLIFGVETTRNPLSGISGGHNGGDLIIPKGFNYDLLIEAKYKASNAQHTLFQGAVDDCVKNKVDPEHAILYTKVKRALDKNTLVTLRATQFHRLMALPGALELFKKDK